MDILGKIVKILANLPDYMSGGLLDLVEKLAGSEGKLWFDELGKFLRRETCWSTRNPYLRSIATGKLVATVGKRTLAKMAKLFTGWLDPDSANWGTGVPGEAKPEALFEVFELIKDGKFAEIFAAFGVDLDQWCWSQDQIITFAENHTNLLSPKGWATFFLFKVGKEFFVASMYRYDSGPLKANVNRLSNDNVWNAENRNRFVFPQLDIFSSAPAGEFLLFFPATLFSTRPIVGQFPIIFLIARHIWPLESACSPKLRNIHKATVHDRLLHHAIYRILYCHFDQKFIYDSYSCRLGKGTHKAVKRFEKFTRKVSRNNTRTCWILKCDIKKLFRKSLAKNWQFFNRKTQTKSSSRQNLY